MVRILRLMLLIPILFAGVPGPCSAAAPQSSPPRISMAYLSGKHFVVQGSGFEDGAIILINGQREKTKPDPQNPGTVLFLKKGRRALDGLSRAQVQVQNPDGEVSAVFDFEHTVTVTLADNGETINLNMGDRLFVLLGTTYDWSFPPSSPYNTNVIAPVPGVGTLIVGAQALLETVNPGQTLFTMEGDPPCRKSTPPCEAPSIQFQITVVVQ